jgi:sugar lactone lactonase YvrE
VTDFALPGRAVFPEGITEGPGTTFYVGSLGDGTIYRGDCATGEVTIAIPPDGDGRQAIAGLAVDGQSRLIACDTEGGQILVYDLRSGSLVARRPIPAGESWPNDVVVVGDTAYITDTRRPLVWRLPSGRLSASRNRLSI